MMNWNGCLNFLKSLINHIAKLIFLIIILYSVSFAQQDSLRENQNPNDSVFVMQKSPWGAVLRSAIIPGWGQIYNESYLKAPVIWGIGAALVYGWIYYNKDYKYYKNLYIQNPQIGIYQRQRDFYRDQRDLFSIYLGLAYLLNMVDAYVDAQLFDFTVQPNNHTNSPMLSLRIKF